MLLNRHEAEDIAQEAFARALARWPRIAGYDLPEAWVRRVPLHQREVLVLHYLADLPVEVISRDFGMPSGTVKTRLAAGRRRLEAEPAKSHQAVRDAR